MKTALVLAAGVANAWVIWPDYPNGTYGAAVAPPVRHDPAVQLKWDDVFTKNRAASWQPKDEPCKATAAGGHRSTECCEPADDDDPACRRGDDDDDAPDESDPFNLKAGSIEPAFPMGRFRGGYPYGGPRELVTGFPDLPEPSPIKKTGFPVPPASNQVKKTGVSDLPVPSQVRKIIRFRKARPLFGFYIAPGAVVFRHRRPTSGSDRYRLKASTFDGDQCAAPSAVPNIAHCGPSGRERRATKDVPGILEFGTWYPWSNPNSVAKTMFREAKEDAEEEAAAPPTANPPNTTSDTVETAAPEAQDEDMPVRRDLSVPNPKKKMGGNVVRSVSLDGLKFPSSISCNQKAGKLPEADYNEAKEELFDYCSISNPEGNQIEVALQGAAAVYACSFAEDTASGAPSPTGKCSEKDYGIFEEVLDDICGKGVPGWVENTNDNRVYGRALRGMNICGDFVASDAQYGVDGDEEEDEEDDNGGDNVDGDGFFTFKYPKKNGGGDGCEGEQCGASKGKKPEEDQ
ncbi:hypothetical protein N3K66_003502 [Trichothecium roseum]|uniref:Uncharacterized protein n=1 Tax=Trichothecium roseum TaxID=47278 RepID=A0ACC0V700_9HYPO|nr:hypothetical protein N3K66_003502 [Trichothecium roseum]